MEITRYGESDIVYKRLDPQTLKTVMYVLPKCLLPQEKVSVEEIIDAAHEVAREIVDFKYNKLKGLGCSQIETSICVNYYGTMFTVEHDMSAVQAKEAYERVVRGQRIDKLGLKLV